MMAVLRLSTEIRMTDLETRWHSRMLWIYDQGKQLSGYNATRFLQKVRRVGGLAAAKDWLSPEAGAERATAGFLTLTEMGRLDISVEANALTLPWRTLFTWDELALAAKRLRSYGYSGRGEIRRVDRRTLIPEEVPSGRELIEGAKTRITINAYERNPAARKRCIVHYGSRCVVCGFSFAQRYGDAVREVVHVHHVRPLASIGRAYRLDPIRDLRPVCPNCHAVIHLQEPPFTVYQVQRMLKRSGRGA